MLIVTKKRMQKHPYAIVLTTDVESILQIDLLPIQRIAKISKNQFKLSTFPTNKIVFVCLSRIM